MTIPKLFVPALAALMASVAATPAQEPPDCPLLSGGARQTILPRHVEAIRTLIRIFSPPADSVHLWMLWRDGLPSQDSDHASVMFDVYLWPQVFTARLIRGSAVVCTSDPADNSWYPDSPIADGLALTDRHPSGYALVAPVDRPFTAAGAFEKPFGVSGEWTDEDLVAVADAVARAVPEQRCMYLRLDAPGRASVTGEGTGKTPNLEIKVQKGDAGWKVTGRSRWCF